MADALITSFVGFIKAHPHLIAELVFLFAFVESLVFLGWLLPGTALLAAMGVLLYSASIEQLITVWLAAWFGTVLGHLLSFLVGAKAKEQPFMVKIMQRHEAMLQRSQAYFAKHGGKSIFLGRFIAPIRPVLPLVAGMSGLSWQRFLWIDAAAGMLWISLYLLPGMAFGNLLHHWWQDINWWSLAWLLTGLMWLLLLRYWHLSWQKRYSALSVVAAITGLLVTLSLHTSFLTHINQVTHDALHLSHHTLFDIISYCGAKESLFFVYAWVSFRLLYERHLLLCTLWSLSGIITAALIGLCKYLLAITRPDITHSLFELYSFPSGHSTLITHISLMLYGLKHQHWPTASKHRYLMGTSALILMVTLSRLITGEHWLSDVIAGLLLGMTTGSISLALLPRIIPPLPHLLHQACTVLLLTVLASCLLLATM